MMALIYLPQYLIKVLSGLFCRLKMPELLQSCLDLKQLDHLKVLVLYCTCLNVRYNDFILTLHVGGHIQIGDELLTANKVSLEGVGYEGITTIIKGNRHTTT